jgi:hypothetical protein
MILETLVSWGVLAAVILGGIAIDYYLTRR